MSISRALVAPVLAASIALVAFEGDADACGGCFHGIENPTVVTDHRMVFSISRDQSTLYDQIKYSGSPASFAWVLPYRGDVTKGEIVVGVSADLLFTTLDSMTQTQLTRPPLSCPPAPPNCNFGSSSGTSGTSGGTSGTSGGSGGVNVLRREVVGPYDTAHLKATDPNALQDWLATNGYNVPSDVAEIITTYQGAGFNFLAVKLVPGQGVQEMRPIRVTTKGANVTLPLRMVAAGTGSVVGISLWVLGEGRYEPQNFPSFFVPTDEIVWDWSQNRSNYTELRAEKTAAGNGRIWEVESSATLYRQQVEDVVKQGSWDGRPPFPDSDEARAATAYLPTKDAQGAVLKTALQVRNEDLETLFYGIGTATSRVTRLRADLAKAALASDLVMRASPDQGFLYNVRQLTKQTGQPPCPTFPGCEGSGVTPGDNATPSGFNGSGSTFSCATGTGGAGAWLVVGIGFLAAVISRARGRRRDRR